MTTSKKTLHESATVVPGQIAGGDVLTYEYGLRLDKDCLRLVEEQITKARRLYNDIIAICRDTVGELQTFVIDRAGSEAVALKAAIEDLNNEFALAKAADDEPAMKRIAEIRREKWKALSVLLKAARKAHSAEIQTCFLSRIGKNSSCPTYLARSKAVEDGLGWGTANAVLDATLKAFKSSFALGKAPRFAIGAEIDQDCLTLQFTTAGGCAASSLLSGKQSDLILLPSNGCGRRKYGEFKFRLGAAKEKQYATGTWQYHRALPDGSHVAMARLVRRRIANNYKWAIQLLVKTKEPIREVVSERQPLVTVHLGWAADVAGRRVAGIADSPDPGEAQILALPPVIEEALQRSAEIQSCRDAKRDEVAGKARAILIPESADERLVELHGRLVRTRPQYISANRLHYLCQLLRGAEMLPDWLEEWRKEDKLRWQEQIYLAKRARNARKNFYREVAIDLARRYEAIAIEPLELAKAAKKVDEITGEKSEFTRKARAGRVVAALYELTSAIKWAALRTGAALIEVAGATASYCSICGSVGLEVSESDHQIVTCKHCGAVIDRKQNGAALAWQVAEAKREDSVTEYWSSHHKAQSEKSARKVEKLAKLAEGRRAARTARDAENM